MAEPIRNPAGEPLDWQDTATWFCFDCETMDADEYCEFDGYVRCADCAALWAEHHLHIEEWR